MSPARWIQRTVATIALLAIAAFAVAVLSAHRYLATPIELQGDGVSFDIRPGTSFAAISNRLAEQGIVDHPRLLRWYARLSGKASAVRAGEYRIDSGLTPYELIDRFVSGQVVLHAFTIVEGWTFRELLAELAEADAVQNTLDGEAWPAIRDILGVDDEHPEGLFLPETYRFPRHATDTELLRQAYDLMQETLRDEWHNRAEGLPLQSPYEALILASIVEKETARADERARIAGVFARRLQSKMRLQTDPTVIYGIGEGFDGNLTRADLRTDTPYNTYTRGGLPPTPIALPGRAAINAALNPAEGTELYFVATGLGDGSHKFSTTKEEHDAAVREYLARQRAARNRGSGN